MNGYVYSRHYYLFYSSRGSCCLRLLFLQQENVRRKFTSAGRSLQVGCGMSIFNVCEAVSSYLAYPGKAYMSD